MTDPITRAPSQRERGAAARSAAPARRGPGARLRHAPWSLVIAALWTLAVLVHVLLTGRWWLMLVPDLAPPIVYFAVPVLILAGSLLARLRRCAPPRGVTLGVAALVLASLALGWSSNGIQAGVLFDGPSGAAPNLRVVSWNTRWWGYHADRSLFFRTIRAQHADVYLLQEYITTDNNGKTILKVDQRALLRRYFPGYRIGVAGELVTLSRLPVVSQHLVGPGAAVGRGAPWQTVFDQDKVLRTDVRVAGRTVSLYNVHMPVQLDLGPSPLGSTFYHLVRANDTARKPQFAGLEKDLRANRNPTLVAGDFNTSPAMGDLRTLRGTMHDAADAGSSLYPVSWNVQSHLTLWRLDWAFTQHGVTVDHYATAPMDRLSDHGAQVLELTVRSARSGARAR